LDDNVIIKRPISRHFVARYRLNGQLDKKRMDNLKSSGKRLCLDIALRGK